MPKAESIKLLILMSGYAKSGVGEQFVQAMLARQDVSMIWRYSTIVADTELDLNYHGYSTITRQVPYSFLPVVSSIQYWRFQKNHLDSCVEEVSDIVKNNKIDLIWTICNGSSIIAVAAGVLDNVSVPMIAQIWDTPEYFGQASRLGNKAMAHLLSNFNKILSKAEKGVTISDSMKKIYLEKYGLSSQTMVFSAPVKSLPESKVLKALEKDSILIVFAGGLYAYKTWNTFLDAIEGHNNSNVLPLIKVKCMGNRSRWDRKRNWVEYESIKPIEEAMQIVNEADIAYLPYWMDVKHAYTVKTAFPSKLSFYTSAGTPIFYHGPEESTPTDFLKKYKVGKACHSTDANMILATIEELLSEEFRMNYAKEQERTIEEVFHPNRMIEIFEEVIAH